MLNEAAQKEGGARGRLRDSWSQTRDTVLSLVLPLILWRTWSRLVTSLKVHWREGFVWVFCFIFVTYIRTIIVLAGVCTGTARRTMVASRAQNKQASITWWENDSFQVLTPFSFHSFRTEGLRLVLMWQFSNPHRFLPPFSKKPPRPQL